MMKTCDIFRMKQLEDNPWDGLAEKYPVGIKMKGKITNIADYGVFVELEPGIEGLAYVSELSWIKPNAHPSKLFKEGQEIEFVILDVDVNKHRISLALNNAQTAYGKLLKKNIQWVLIERKINILKEQLVNLERIKKI